MESEADAAIKEDAEPAEMIHLRDWLAAESERCKEAIRFGSGFVLDYFGIARHHRNSYLSREKKAHLGFFLFSQILVGRRIS